MHQKPSSPRSKSADLKTVPTPPMLPRKVPTISLPNKEVPRKPGSYGNLVQ